ncbi:putative Copper transport protein [Zostera marina]|uniref:Putative Copper transport protein n=1 Tax=Zostera marina TaxID=29655 RepID=A0A0K9PC19_ZOSMR|nr:putative Copper transport protein [Zostera marina]
MSSMETEKPWTTELSVRMDCNGCVQRMRRALNGVKGVHDIQIDMPQQKITVVGKADPEKMVKAIKKTKKIATISSHIDNSEEPAAPPSPDTDPPPPAPAEEPPATEEETPPAPEEAKSEENPPPPPQEEIRGEIPMVHPYPHQWNNYVQDQFPYHDNYYLTPMHSYNNSEPPSSAKILVVAPGSFHLTNEYYDHQQQNYGGGTEDNINSIFSDENPNACIIF